MQKLPLDAAVFDFQFSPRDPSLFAVALSAALVLIYRIVTCDDDPSVSAKIEFIRAVNVHEDASQLTLFLAWIPPGENESEFQTIQDGFAVSFSNGQVSVFYTKPGTKSLAQGASMSEVRLTGVPVEIWYVAFFLKTLEDQQVPMLFAGDDMSRICGVSLDQIENEQENVSFRDWQITDRGQSHDAGVTAILPLFGDESSTILLTGSYDEHIRVYHFTRRSDVLASKNLGGGVWRLKVIKSEVFPAANEVISRTPGKYMLARRYLILASCMHGGSRLVRIQHSISESDLQLGAGNWDIDVLAEFKEHESMNYASDFLRSRKKEEMTGENTVTCVTSSFYDRRVCVWKADI